MTQSDPLQTTAARSLIYWLVLTLLIATAGVALYTNRSLRTRLGNAAQDARVAKDKVARRSEALTLVGRRLEWAGLEQPNSGTAAQPLLVLAFNQGACIPCRDSETQFANKISATYGTDSVRAVISHADRGYLGGYVRTNAIAFPVLLDSDGTFSTRNEIGEEQVGLLLDSTGVIVAADFPISGEPEWSLPFQEAVTRYFEAQRKAK